MFMLYKTSLIRQFCRTFILINFEVQNTNKINKIYYASIKKEFDSLYQFQSNIPRSNVVA